MKFDLIVVGSGAAGMISAIVAAKYNKKVLLLEKLPKIASKLKASGGGRCNLTNTLSNDDFMLQFKRDGRFMQDMLKLFNAQDLRKFLYNIGVETHAPDGFRVFPTSHNSTTIIEAFQKELNRQNVMLLCNQNVQKILTNNNKIEGVITQNNTFYTSKLIIATGGKGFSTLGTTGDGYTLTQPLGHTTTPLYPAMLPLKTKETWTQQLRADTIPKATLQVALKKHKKLKATGDLIFTKNGIRGPVVLDFAREITPLIEKYTEVPLLLNMAKGMDEDTLMNFFKKQDQTLLVQEILQTVFPQSLSQLFISLLKIDSSLKYNQLKGVEKVNLLKIATATPLTIIGHDGFEKAMVTRGGISLKEINPKTMESKLIQGLYFCGEVLNIDGPCGGYNLQFCFSSGFLCGTQIGKN